MARGYLGKISAIVTANTSDLSRNLNAGAKDVRAFAQTVQRDISRLTTEANKQFSAILTPLQKFERALEAAASRKLSFKGFDGAIRTVEDLRKRLATLTDGKVIDLAVKASGLADVARLRQSIADLSQRQIRILAEVGGLDKLKELRSEAAAAGGEVKLRVGVVRTAELNTLFARVNALDDRSLRIVAEVGGLDQLRELRQTILDAETKSVTLSVGVVGIAEVDAAIEKLTGISSQRLQAVIDVVGQEGLETALRTQRQLVSAAEQIAKPLAQATTTFQTLAFEVQGAFIGSLVNAQGEVEKLKSDIVAGAEISQQRFASLEGVVIKTAAAIERVAAISTKLGGISTSNTPFADPEIIDLLNRFAEAQKNATQIPGVARSGDQFSKLAADVQAAARGLEVLVAKQEASATAGERTQIQGQINAETQQLEKLIREYEILAGARARAAQNLAISGAAQGFDVESLSEISSAARRAQADVTALQREFQEFIDLQSQAGDRIQFRTTGTFRSSDIKAFEDEARTLAETAQRKFQRQGSLLEQRQKIELAVQVSGAESLEKLRLATAAFAAELRGVGSIDSFSQQERTALELSKIAPRILGSAGGIGFLLSDGKALQKSIGGLFKELGGSASEFGRNLASALQQGLVSFNGTQDELTDLIISLSTAKTAADLQLDRKIRISPAQLENLSNLNDELRQITSQTAALNAIGRERVELAIKVTGAENLDELRKILGGSGFDSEAASIGSVDEVGKNLADTVAVQKGFLNELKQSANESLRLFDRIESGAGEVASAARAAFDPFGVSADSSRAKVDALVAALKKLDAELGASGFAQGAAPVIAGEEATDMDSDFRLSVRELNADVKNLGKALREAAATATARLRARGVFDEVRTPEQAARTRQVIEDEVSAEQAKVLDRLLGRVSSVQTGAELRTMTVNAPQQSIKEAEAEVQRLKAAFAGVEEAAQATEETGNFFDQLASRIKKVRQEIERLGDVPGADRLRLDLAGIVTQSTLIGERIGGDRPLVSRQLELANEGVLQEQVTRDAILKRIDADPFGKTDARAQLAEVDARIEKLKERARQLTEQLGKAPSETEVIDFLSVLFNKVAAAEEATAKLTAEQERAKKAASDFAATLNSLPEGSGPRRSIEALLPPGGLPPGSPPPEDVRRQAEEAADRFGQLGLSVDDPKRRLDVLRGSLVSLKGQIDSLPVGLRAQFVPAIKEAEDEFIRLSRLPSATSEEIERAAAEVRRLGAAASNAARFSQAFGESFDQSRIDQYSARLGALRGVLVQVGAVAGTQAAAAFERLRIEMQDAATSGNFGARVAEIRRLEQEAIRLAAAFGGIPVGRVNDTINRAGDVGRMGFDRFTLAIQQAGFAIDDFFSVTGALDQRIRAVGNNITQLAFLLGGTTGLFIGIGAVLGLQVLVPLVRFIFETETATEALKALNDALEQNQRNVDTLANSYRRLADEIAGIALTESDQRERSRQQRVDEITSQRNAVEEEAFAASSPEVVRIRAERAVLERQRNESEDIDERLRIQRQIEENRRREEQVLAARGAGEGEALLVDSADRAVAAQETRLNRALLRERLGRPVVPGEEVDAVRRDLEAARERRRIAAERTLPGATTPLGTRIQRDALSESLAQAEQAREDLLRSFPRGVPAEGDPSRPTRLAELDQTIDDLRERIGVLGEILGSQLATELIEESFGISDTLSAVSQAIEGEISDIEGRRAELGREITAIAAELETLTDPERAEELKRQQEAIKEQSEELLSSARAVRGFTDVLNKAAGDLARTVESELASAAQSARRSANAAEAQFGAESPRTAAARSAQERLEAAQRDATERRRAIDARINQQRIRFTEDILAGRADPQVAARAQRIRELETVRDDEDRSAREREDARRQIEILQQQQEDAFNNLPQVRALQEAADRGDVQAQRELQQIESAERGRQLSQTPAQRAAEEVVTGLEDIRQFFGQQAEATTGLTDQEGRNAAASRFVEGQIRAAAPAIFSLADSVANAVLQGPSRAALQATDVSTVEGQRELNRLLRGDDGARDQNIVELEKQSQLLEGIKTAAERTAQQMGIVLDLK